MYENYAATKEDLVLIEKGLSFVWKKELDFVFKDKGKISNTIIVSFDSQNIYIWAREEKGYKLSKLNHNLKIKDEDQQGLRASLRPKELVESLPEKWQKDNFEIPKISGGLITPFLNIQKSKNLKNNPYTTKESYLATIIHEFGHVYFNQNKSWFFSNKDKNISNIEAALSLYRNKKINLDEIELEIPSYEGLSEIFAFCTEYAASEIFWPEHKEAIDKRCSGNLNLYIPKEKERNLNTQDSVLVSSHFLACVYGKILLEKHPKDWPQQLIKTYKLSPYTV